MPRTHATNSAARHTEDVAAALRQDLSIAKRALDTFLADEPAIRRIAEAAAMISEAFGAGRKLLAVGNGGSCADALHFCEELTGRFREDREPLPAIACSDPGHITCTANDYGYEEVFARWVRALGRSGDVLVALSTSGNSPNVVRAVDAATDRGMKTVALLGKGGGKIAGRCDLEWIVPGDRLDADRVQEVHMLILHSMVRAIELRMFGANPGST